MRTLLSWLVACAALLALVAGCVTAPGTLDADLSTLRSAATSAAVDLNGGDRVGAVETLQDAVELADSLDSSGFPGAAKATPKTKFEKQLEQLRKKFRLALLKANDAGVATPTAARAIGQAGAAAAAAQVTLQSVDGGGVRLDEVNAKSAGFHDAGKSVLFRIRVDSTCAETPVVTVTDLSGGAVEPNFTVVRRDAAGNQVVRVDMGAVAGAGRVEATACGTTRVWELYNYGPKQTVPKPEPQRFDGTWQGEWSGTAVVPGLGRQQVGGGVAFTVANGRLNITDPGRGAGTVTGSGRSRFSGGGGVTAAARYTFQGLFVEFVIGGTSASGNWRATFNGGTASGRWSAARVGP